ncbi:pyridine nucleotide-disulfide oxidoreductase [bacterium]|nr:pyridine nucleotide-disulfide oxidoreductase [bacterium]
MAKHLVIVGGGHAHLTVLLRLAEFTGKGHRVTVISPDPYHYYSGMGPGMLSGIYEPRQIRFHIRKMSEERGASFIADLAVAIDPDNRSITLGSGRMVTYDVASFNTGSGIPVEPTGAPSERIIPVKPIVNLYRARREILKELEQRDLLISVVGGGPAGVEIAANLWRLARDTRHKAEITLVGGDRILGRFPKKVRGLALGSLNKRTIHVLEATRGRTVAGGRILLSDGNILHYDYAFMAVGVRPCTLFSDSGLATGEDGGMLVDSFLRSTSHPELFGGGDCISLSGNLLAKVGVYAVRQNPILLHNLMAALEGGKLQPFRPGGAYMLIMNMGDGTGIFWKREHVWDGRPAFLLKDFVDRRFMRKFQVSGELDEPDGEIG